MSELPYRTYRNRAAENRAAARQAFRDWVDGESAHHISKLQLA